MLPGRQRKRPHRHSRGPRARRSARSEPQVGSSLAAFGVSSVRNLSGTVYRIFPDFGRPGTCSLLGMAAPKKWVRTVTTDSTLPPAGLFTKDAATIARTLASKKVSPKGPGSGMRMLTYFINRGGRGLSKTRRAELERAKKLLSERVKRARELS